MAWVAVDRAVKAVEGFGLNGPVTRWRALRDEIRREILAKGYAEDRHTFTQFYGSRELDAALLMIPLVGFLPATDERVLGTVAAIERELLEDGFVQRYTQIPGDSVDGLPAGEGAFLACTFWLADNYALMGRHDEAREVFERLLALRNDVGLLSEEYDPKAGRLVGNFPQAFSHVPLIDTPPATSRRPRARLWNGRRKDSAPRGSERPRRLDPHRQARRLQRLPACAVTAAASAPPRRSGRRACAACRRPPAAPGARRRRAGRPPPPARRAARRARPTLPACAR